MFTKESPLDSAASRVYYVKRRPKMANLVSVEVIAAKIFQVRGKKVMLDRDLAELYNVETKNLFLKRNLVV